MRILVANNFFVPRTTGSAHFAEGMARHFAAVGHEVLVVTTSYGDSPSDEERDGYHIVRMPSYSLSPKRIAFNYSLPFTLRPKNVSKLRGVVDSFDPDVVHQHGQFFDLTWMTSVLALRRHIPRVLTVHTALTHDHPLYRRVIRLGDRAVVRPLTNLGKPTFVVIDKFIDGYVRAAYDPPDDRRVFIPIGVEPERFAGADAARVRKRHDLGERPIILSLGHVIPLRDRMAIVRALPRIRERHSDVALLVVGEVYDTRFLAVADELGVRDSIVLAGRVERDEVPDYIAAATVEGHDHQRYGLGNATLEVMCAGVPVFAVLDTDNYPGVDLGRWPDLQLLPSDAPNVVADAVCRLIDDAGLRRRAVAAQEHFIEDLFSLSAIGDRYLELFAELTNL